MSNESFWKKIQNIFCPPNIQPPSVWTTMMVIIILGGVASWLFGMPWQAVIPITIVLLLFATGGQWLGKRIRKEEGYDIPGAPPQKAMSPWAIFWFVVLLALFTVAIRLPGALEDRYPSWPDWSWVIPYFIALITLIVIGIIYLYKRSKKQQKELTSPNNFSKELNMNQGTNKPLSPAQQELKLKARKTMLPVGLLFIAGLGSWVLSFSLDVSRVVSILIMTTGGLCWGIACAMMLPLYLSAIQIQQGKSEPSEEQTQKNKIKLKRIQIIIIVLFIVLMLAASLLMFQQ